MVTVYTVVHAMECYASEKGIPTLRSCDGGHAFASKNRKPRRTTVGEPENAMKRRKALLSEKELLRKERDKRVRELLKHVSRLCTSKNRTEHNLASMRSSETIEQAIHRQEHKQTHCGKHESF